MRVLLINPNRYKFPPVPPIGLEHVAAVIGEGGHVCEILDLCFSDSPYEDMDKSIVSFKPDIVGVTVRNVDTVLYQTNEFFLDEIRDIISHIRRLCGLKVIVGGTGVATDPEGVLEYLGADYAVAGPAEGCINELLADIRLAKNGGRRIRFRKYRYDISCPRSTNKVDYRKYVDHGGIAGFDTHKGCSSSCVYCIEANTRVSFKSIPDVIGEIRGLVDAGCRRFHLCDSEFNEDLDYSLDFCSVLKKEGLGIDWALYMKPANYNKKLFKLMKESGVSLITLTVDSWKKCPLYWTDIEKIVFLARSSGIRIVVDFLCGFPYEEEETLLFCLDLFRRVRPDSVGINAYIRLYERLLITDIILKDKKLLGNVIGLSEGGRLVRPVFYNHISPERLKKLMACDGIFRIEGIEKGVNYSRRGPDCITE
jgi:hypothetical protein